MFADLEGSRVSVSASLAEEGDAAAWTLLSCNASCYPCVEGKGDSWEASALFSLGHLPPPLHAWDFKCPHSKTRLPLCSTAPH